MNQYSYPPHIYSFHTIISIYNQYFDNQHVVHPIMPYVLYSVMDFVALWRNATRKKISHPVLKYIYVWSATKFW